MLILDHAVRCTLRRTALMWIVTLLAIALPATVQGQVTGFVTAAVGGVSVDAKGALRIVDLAREGYFDRIRLEAIPGAMNHDAEFRKVSLAALEAALKECLDSGKPIPDAMQTLAGLQGIRYMLLYPEQHDIVLVGPAGPWKVDKRGNVVGVANGRPVLLLDDLVTALRALGGRVRMLMTCSIDPTQEGIQRVRSLRKHKESDPDPAEAAAAFGTSAGAAKDHRDRRPRYKPFRPGDGGGRLPDEADLDEPGAGADSMGCRASWTSSRRLAAATCYRVGGWSRASSL